SGKLASASSASAVKTERSGMNCWTSFGGQSDISAVYPDMPTSPTAESDNQANSAPLEIDVMPARLSRRQFGLASLALGSSLVIRPAVGQGSRKYPPVIPGTGIRVARTGDDFEAEDW